MNCITPAAASHARGVREVQLTDRGGRAHIAGRRGRTSGLDGVTIDDEGPRH